MTTPLVPDEHYLWLGRISASYGMLDVQIGLLGHAAITGEKYTEDWSKLAGSPGAAVKLCERALPGMPADLADRAQELLEAAKPLRLRRHQLSHSVFVMDPTDDGPSAPWLLKDPKGSEGQLLEAVEGEAVVRAINRLSREASEIRAAVSSR